MERSNTVALDFGRELFGSVGAIVFACLVAISCFGAVNGKMPPHLDPTLYLLDLKKAQCSPPRD